MRRSLEGRGVGRLEGDASVVDKDVATTVLPLHLRRETLPRCGDDGNVKYIYIYIYTGVLERTHTGPTRCEDSSIKACCALARPFSAARALRLASR